MQISGRKPYLRASYRSLVRKAAIRCFYDSGNKSHILQQTLPGPI